MAGVRTYAHTDVRPSAQLSAKVNAVHGESEVLENRYWLCTIEGHTPLTPRTVLKRLSISVEVITRFLFVVVPSYESCWTSITPDPAKMCLSIVPGHLTCMHL